MNRDSGKRLAGGKPPKPVKKKGGLGWQQITLIVVTVLLALALGVVLLWRSLVVRPELPPDTSQGGAPTVDTDGDGQPDASGIDWGEGVRPRGSGGERKSENYWTVLILGRDTGGGGNTDTMLLASYDVTNQKATVMSIPRDTMVNIPQDIKRINAVYNYYGGGQKGIQGLYKEISQLVGFEPDFQVVVEWDAVGEIVDAMGGVYFDVPRNMNYDDPFQDLHIHQTAGYRLLTGSDAMQVLRYRHDNNMKYGYPDGDLGRIKTQQAFLKAMVEQLLQFKNMTKINALIDVFKRNVETDLSLQNILWFAQSAVFGGLKQEDVNFVTMPNTAAYVYSRTVGNKQSYVVPNARQLLDLVNNELSPFTEVFTMSDLDIMSVNSDGSIRSSTGYVEDRRAASPPPVQTAPKPAEDPEDQEDPENPETPGENGGEGQSPEGGTGPIIIDPSGGTQDPGGFPEDPGQTDPGVTTDPGMTTDPGVTTDPGDVTDPGQTDPGVTPEPAPVPEPVPEPAPAPEPAPQEPGFTFIEEPPTE